MPKKQRCWRRAGGGATARERHLSRGKLLPRERVAGLLDPGTPFLEIGATAAHGMYGGDAPGAGLIAGIGRVAGRECMIVCNDATVKGGTYYPMTVKKHLRAQEIAAENRLPCIYLVDSGGANLPNQDEVFPDRDHFGRIFYNQAKMSAAGIAQIAVVMGSCTAGGAYVPAMSDETIIVRRSGDDLSGRAAAGEGGDRRDGHRRRISAAPTSIPAFPASPTISPRRRACARRGAASGCRRSTGESSRGRATRRRTSRFMIPPRSHGIVPADLRTPYDIREVIARIVDGSRFDEFKARFGTTLVCGFAHIDGIPVGDRRQQRRPVLGERAQGRAFHRALLAAPHSAGLPPEHHRLHGRAQIRGRGHRQAWREAGHGGCDDDGAEGDRDHRRLLRRRQLRHVRPRLPAAFPLDLAEEPHLR